MYIDKQIGHINTEVHVDDNSSSYTSVFLRKQHYSAQVATATKGLSAQGGLPVFHRSRTTLGAVIVGIGVIIMTPGVASASASDTPAAIAARVHAQHDDLAFPADKSPWCGPGQSYSVYDVTTGGDLTTCTPTVYVPHQLEQPKTPIWKFWVWVPKLFE